MLVIAYILHFFIQWWVSDLKLAIIYSIYALIMFAVIRGLMWFLYNIDNISYKIGKFAVLSK